MATRIDKPLLYDRGRSSWCRRGHRVPQQHPTEAWPDGSLSAVQRSHNDPAGLDPTAFSLDLIPTFAIGTAAEYTPADASARACEPEQEYFAEGMVEEIITALSQIRWLFVIARNSTFTYRAKPPR